MADLGWVEGAIGVLSPSWAAKRLASRRSLERLKAVGKRRGYEGATKGRRMEGWFTTGSSANGEIQASLETLRNRSRAFVRDNPYARKAIDTYVANVVGSGIVAQSSGRAESMWRRWAGSTECDADGRLNMHGLQALVARTEAESGEVLVRRIFRRPDSGLSVPLQLKVLEPDHLDSSRDHTRDKAGRRVSQGIELDDQGRRTAYYLFRTHPGEPDQFLDTESVRVPASEILHVYQADRPGQLRGVPRGSAAFLRLRNFDEYEDAQLQKQLLSSAQVGVVIHPEVPERGFGETDESGKPKPPTDYFEPGAFWHAGPGEDVKFNNPPSIQGYSDYTTQVLRSVASAWGVTYEQMTGDFSRVNFSSARMARLEFERRLKGWWHGLLIPQFCDPAWRWFAEAAGLNPERASVTWTPPRREMIEPLKEVQAITAAIRSGLMTRSHAQKEQGFDPLELMAEYAHDLEVSDELGITLDSDPRTGGASGGSGGGSSGQSGGNEEESEGSEDPEEGDSEDEEGEAE